MRHRRSCFVRRLLDGHADTPERARQGVFESGRRPDLAHIDAQHGQNYDKVLRSTAADTVYTGGLPLIFVVAADGTFAGAIDHKQVANGSQYDLTALEEELSRLYASALIPNDPYRKILRKLPPIGGWPEGEAPDDVTVIKKGEELPPSP